MRLDDRLRLPLLGLFQALPRPARLALLHYLLGSPRPGPRADPSRRRAHGPLLRPFDGPRARLCSPILGRETRSHHPFAPRGVQPPGRRSGVADRGDAGRAGTPPLPRRFRPGWEARPATHGLHATALQRCSSAVAQRCLPEKANFFVTCVACHAPSVRFDVLLCSSLYDLCCIIPTTPYARCYDAHVWAYTAHRGR